MNKKEADVLIIGTGLAGIYTALNINRNHKIMMLAKSSLDSSNSMLAQGGIAAELTDDPIRLDSHFEDTLKAGSYLNDREAVEYLVNHAKEAIESLVAFGIHFDKDDNNHYLLTREGGHSRNRILHSGGDMSGYYTTKGLSDLLKDYTNITVKEHTMAIDIIFNEEKEAIGVKVLEKGVGSYPIFAKAIILATGGIGSIYGATTNDLSATGDGIGIAIRAGAEVKNMEFVQFHPTALYQENIENKRRFLISEAVRGEGATLLNIRKERFMNKYSPKLKELAPRDIVSQAIYREMYDTWTDHVYLDTRNLDPEFLKKRFPTIYRTCKEAGYTLGVDLIPVAPCEHFLCGGIKTDLHARTTIKNLYAVGETAMTGVHGANRLASNSLLECVVFGKTAADMINKTIDSIKIESYFESEEMPAYDYNYRPIRKKISDYMDEHVGIVRTSDGLKLAEKTFASIMESLLKSVNMTRYYYETLNMVTTAITITRQALIRKESIGCHFRLD